MRFAYVKTGHAPPAFRLRDLAVFFSDERCLEIIRSVLDEKGSIRDFPGIVEDERWERKQRVGIPPDVRYEAQFYALEDQTYLMKWMIQPSGWEWVDDDGFGFPGDSSIMLYSVIDGSGSFTKKFELFSIDGTRYCHDFDQYLDGGKNHASNY